MAAASFRLSRLFYSRLRLARCSPAEWIPTYCYRRPSFRLARMASTENASTRSSRRERTTRRIWRGCVRCASVCPESGATPSTRARRNSSPTSTRRALCVPPTLRPPIPSSRPPTPIFFSSTWGTRSARSKRAKASWYTRAFFATTSPASHRTVAWTIWARCATSTLPLDATWRVGGTTPVSARAFTPRSLFPFLGPSAPRSSTATKIRMRPTTHTLITPSSRKASSCGTSAAIRLKSITRAVSNKQIRRAGHLGFCFRKPPRRKMELTHGHHRQH